MSSRWMTPKGREQELAHWSTVRAEHLTDDQAGEGGRGYPDAPIFDLCDQLNALPGLCTLQSCAGHPREDGSYYEAQLWLWLDEWTARRFYLSARRLAAHPLVRIVRVQWLRDGQEFVDVIFTGQGPHWDESQSAVLHFFTRLMAQHPAHHQATPEPAR